jgi:hypothetical protein
MKLLIWTNRILLTFFVLLSILGVAGKLVFGHGLGDLVYYIIVWVASLAFITIFIFKKAMPTSVLSFITIVFVFILLYLIYMMTVGRGPEYRWNGNILY